MSYVPQEILLGSPTGIFSGRDEPLTHYFYPDEFFAVGAIQASAVSVDQTVRDAFTNGLAEDLRTVIEANGMQLQYLRITWNEYPNFEIRDMNVGVVVKAISPNNITAQRLITVLSSVPWYRGLISKLPLLWKSYGMSFPPAAHPPDVQYSWLAEMISNPYSLSSLTEVPSPPPVDEVRAAFIASGQVDSGLGEFTRNLLDQGYTVTLLGYQVKVCFETVRTWQQGDRSWAEYRTHIGLQVQLTTTPELGAKPLIGPVLMAAILKGLSYIILAIGAAVGIAYYLYGMSHTETITEKWGWVLNPDTNVWEWKLLEKTQDTKPPDWWSWVFIVAGLSVGGYAVYKITSEKK